MAIEIERKFLIHTKHLDELTAKTNGTTIKQGYVSNESHAVVRVRIKGELGFLTLKGKNKGSMRQEYEYPIPVEDAEEILITLCNGPIIEKTRFIYQYDAHTWEIDVFEGENQGLVVAEVELSTEDEHVNLPPWVKEEVTGDARYYNSNLINHPYSQW